MWIKFVQWVATVAGQYLLARGLKESPQPNDARIVEFARLRPDLLDRLERECVPPYVSPSTTDLMAGYIIGTQAVLQKLRVGYAIG